MLPTGKINYEVGDQIAAIPFGGLAAIHQMVVALGLPQEINDALSLLKVHMRPRACVRGDTDFSLTENFDRWAGRIDFLSGMDNIAALRKPADDAAVQLDEHGQPISTSTATRARAGRSSRYGWGSGPFPATWR